MDAARKDTYLAALKRRHVTGSQCQFYIEIWQHFLTSSDGKNRFVNRCVCQQFLCCCHYGKL